MVTAPSEFYSLSLHDALPISGSPATSFSATDVPAGTYFVRVRGTLAGSATQGPASNEVRVVVEAAPCATRSEEHTSELQSLTNLVCRLLLEKKKKLITEEFYA